MAVSKIVLDRQAEAKSFQFGTTAAAGQGLVTINNGTAAGSNVVLDVKGSATIAGDINLTGNLNITGAIDTQTVTNTNVKDKTITVNDGGTTAGAAGSGLVVEGDAGASIGTIIYDAATTSKFKVGATGTEKEIVTVSDTQTLTNKTISGANNTISNVSLTTGVTGTLAIANGGTNATTANAALNNLLPSQTGNAGRYLTTDGTNASWAPLTVTTFRRTTVTGTQDGTNKTFTIGNTLTTNSEQVILNGQVLNPGSTNDYTISGTTVTFASGFPAPTATDVIQVFGAY